LTKENKSPLYGVCIDKVIERKEPWQYKIGEKDSKAVMDSVRSLAPVDRIAVVTHKVWPRRRLTVAFLEGERKIQNKVKLHARAWSQYANIRLVFVGGVNADIRIAFDEGDGSWSNIGTDALSVDKDEPTMNYGWLNEDSADTEYSRVVKHEFGHALGAIHEHSSPGANIDWNKEAVYRELGGPPNNWPKEVVDHKVFQRYSKTITQYTKFDPKSIMLYPVPARWTNNNKAVGGDNSDLSSMDKEFIKAIYP
jgi:hypothetical protein